MFYTHKTCRNALLMCKYLIYFRLAQATSTPLNHRANDVRFNRRPLPRRKVWNPPFGCNTSPDNNDAAIRASSTLEANRSCLRQLLKSESDFHIFGATTRVNRPEQPLMTNLRHSAKIKLHSALCGWKRMFHFFDLSYPLRFLTAGGQAVVVLLSIPLWLVALYIVTVEYIFTAHRSGNRILRSESIC